MAVFLRNFVVPVSVKYLTNENAGIESNTLVAVLTPASPFLKQDLLISAKDNPLRLEQKLKILFMEVLRSYCINTFYHKIKILKMM